MRELQSGTLLQGGKYRIDKSLGQGGFGITYLAEQTNLNRKICIKEFFMKEYGERTESTNTDADATVLTGVSAVTSAAAEIMGRYREKFVKEARTIARLDHPGIVRIHDVFEENGTAYYVMDFIEGDNLNDMVKREGPLSEDRALGYIRQIADALSYVHSRNIMHLDVKPANVLVRKSDDKAILIDFGTAKQYDSEGTQTSTTPIGLSAGYAPIEMTKPGGVQTFSPETDVYSLGATLYYLVTGQNPPDASERMEMIEEGETLRFPEPVSASVSKTIEKSMRTRKKRIQTVALFLESLPTLNNVVQEESRPHFCFQCGRELAPDTRFCPNCGTYVRNTRVSAVVMPKPGSSVESCIVSEFKVKVGDVVRAGDTLFGYETDKATFEEEAKVEGIVLAIFWKNGDEIPCLQNVLVIGAPGESFAEFDPNAGGTAPAAKNAAASAAEVPNKAAPAKAVQGALTGLAKEKMETGVENGHEWVDLGLSVKWATSNLGATSPEQIGSFFAWGEVNPKTLFSDKSYSFRRLLGVSASKYNNRDKKRQLDLTDDAARHHWGGQWRMPTSAEWKELIENCTFNYFVELNGTKGFLVVSKINGNSIFLPNSYEWDDDEKDKECLLSEMPFYWSATCASELWAYRFEGLVGGGEAESLEERHRGLPIRPVAGVV